MTQTMKHAMLNYVLWDKKKNKATYLSILENIITGQWWYVELLKILLV